MKKRMIGGAEVSCLGIGAMSFADFYGATTEEASFAILDLARDCGVTHIDTANIYGQGRSENAIGAWLAANPGARDRVHIATKAGITADAQGNRCFDNTPEHMEAQLDASLGRLGVDCVDLFYVHRYQAEIPVEEVAGTMGRLVAKGKCKAIGLSEIAPATLRRAQAEYPVAAVQSEYSLSTRAPELGLIQTCAELGVALVAFSPVGRSLLTDDPVSRARIETNPFLSINPRFLEPNYSANLRLLEGFRALAAEMGLSAAGLSVAWALHKGSHVIPIPGTRSVPHFRELVAGAEAALSPEDMARIETVLPVGWCHGDRYATVQWVGPENYC
ncbi:aldo/keto reductase [Salipiger sp. P9]|uniref:aldo/keto reductase n=1 Tax=Salipiger pentaromativorans TaxID=2943193 RepID=UPI0021584C39|nr:aldo/keto reductase [Salipiger pentaromativorans]MCR8546637.1 aldo/keto reductase [Salipiger pentaromativorans]